jgi:pimeloyl-ACP methyl ester carboxylesterase
VLEVVPDVEDLAASLRLNEFSVIGISGGGPYALACLDKLSSRIRSVTIISGMGPTRLKGALSGMDRRRRLALELGSRYPNLARKECSRWAIRFQANPERFLKRLVRTWPDADQALFSQNDVFTLFLRDLHQVFSWGNGPATFAQDLWLYRHFGFPLAELPNEPRVTLWHGLQDTIVPPAMAWELCRTLPSSELHLLPGGHFVAITISDQIIHRMKQHLDTSASAPFTGPR